MDVSPIGHWVLGQQMRKNLNRNQEALTDVPEADSHRTKTGCRRETRLEDAKASIFLGTLLRWIRYFDLLLHGMTELLPERILCCWPLLTQPHVVSTSDDHTPASERTNPPQKRRLRSLDGAMESRTGACGVFLTRARVNRSGHMPRSDGALRGTPAISASSNPSCSVSCCTNKQTLAERSASSYVCVCV